MRHILGALALAGLATAAPAQDAAEDAGFLERLIQDALSSEGQTVAVRGLQGALSSQAQIGEIVISDADGAWLTVSDVELSWSRLALIRRRFEVSSLTIGEVDVMRTPAAQEASLPAAETSGVSFALPELPVSVNIESVRLDRLVLGSPLVGEEVVGRFEGSVQLADGAGQANLSLERIDGTDLNAVVSGAFENESGELTVDIGLTEAAGGLVSRKLGIVGAPSLDFSIDGTGPLSDFIAAIALKTDDQDRLSGQIEIADMPSAADAEPPGRVISLDIGGDITPLFVPEYREFFGDNIQLSTVVQALSDGRIVLSNLDATAQALELTGQAALAADRWPTSVDLTARLASGTGAPVLLPVAGPPVRIDTANLTLQLDRRRRDGWQAGLVVEGLDTEALDLGTSSLLATGNLIRPTEDRAAEVRADIRLDLSDIEPASEDLATAIGTGVTGGFKVDYVTAEPIQFSDVTVSGADYGLTGQGAFNPDPNALSGSGTGTFSAEDLTRFAALVGVNLTGRAELSVTGDADISAGAYRVGLDGNTTDLGIGQAQVDALVGGNAELRADLARDSAGTRLEALALSTPEVTASASADLTSANIIADLDATLRDMATVIPNASGPLDLSADVDGEGGQINASAKLGNGGNDWLSLTGTTDRALTTVNADLTAPDLARFADLAGTDLTGSAEANLALERPTETALNITFSADTTDLGVGIAEIDALIGGQGTLGLTATQNGSDISLRDLRLTTDELDVSGSAEANGQDVTADLVAVLNDLGALVPGQTGPLTTTGTVRTDASGYAADLALAHRDEDWMDLTAETTPDLGEFSGRLSARDLSRFADLAGLALTGSMLADFEGGLGPDEGAFRASVDATTEGLAVGIAEADALLAGTGILSADLSQNDGTTELESFELATDALNAEGSASFEPGRAVADFSARLADLGLVVAGQSGPLTAEGTVETTNDRYVAMLDVGQEEGPWLDIDGSAATDLSSFDAKLVAEDLSRLAQLADAALSGAVTTDLSGTRDPATGALTASITAETTDLGIGQAQLDRLLEGTGTLSVDVEQSGDDIDLSALDFQTDELSLTGDGGLSGGAANADISAVLRNLGVIAPGYNGRLTVDGKLAQDASGLSVDVAANGPGLRDLALTATAPGDLSTIDGRLRGSADLALANEFVAPTQMRGDIRLDLTINGPPALGSVGGQVRVSRGEVAIPGVPFSLANLTATVGMSGSSATIDLSTLASNGGRILVAGTAGLAAPFAGDIGVTLDNVRVTDGGFYDTTIRGDLAVVGPLTGGGDISGALILDKTEIRLSEAPPIGTGGPDGISHVGESRASFITRERAGLVKPEREAGPAAPPFGLDVSVASGDSIFVRGRGLDAELGGEVTIGGTTAAIVPVGQFDLIRGRFNILTSRLDLNEGSIALAGDLVPILDLSANSSVDGTTITVSVTGDALDPDIEFSSSPSLPEDEVLALLLFGEDISNLSAFQALQLGNSLLVLSGRGGRDLSSGIRNALNVDDIDISTNEDGAASFSAGKYISDNIYTGIGVDADGGTVLDLNLDLTDSFTARGSVNSQGQNSIGLFFERDY
ncbi:MAG: translocation/assembly module TamB domain-containing protein [Pseudomonadota bacterium]